MPLVSSGMIIYLFYGGKNEREESLIISAVKEGEEAVQSILNRPSEESVRRIIGCVKKRGNSNIAFIRVSVCIQRVD